MWELSFLGIDFYHIVLWFIFYSIIGWFLESVYMSFCNKKITNRGFVRGPFCPIYGFGFVGAYFIFRPIASHFVLLFISAAIVATVFEYIVGIMMIKLLGALWWDYNDKPFNYKGIICLESTLGWGLYACCFFGFLHRIVWDFSDRIDMRYGRAFCYMIAVIFMLDFSTQLMRVLHFRTEEHFRQVKDTYAKLKAKFY